MDEQQLAGSSAPSLSLVDIEGLVSPEILARGRAYARQGAVLRVVRRADQLQAEVEGTTLYDVLITFDGGALQRATCTCPYGWGYCKHIVAVLLTCLDQPQMVEERASLASLLAGLERAELQTLVERLAASDPHLFDVVESYARARWRGGEDDAPAVGSSPAEPAQLRSRLRAALRNPPYWREPAYGERLSLIGHLFEDAAEQMRATLRVGEVAAGLTILETLTDEYVAQRYIWAENDAYLDFADRLDTLWTEALLLSELPRAERERWAERLAGWAGDLEDVGGEELFWAAEQAALQSWDDERLQRVLRGVGAVPDGAAGRAEAAEPDQEELADDLDWAGEERLTLVRLQVLEQQGRHEEYLHLAAATEQWVRYVTMLVRLGRVAEAVDQGRTRLREPEGALALVRALEAAGAGPQALEIAAHGIGLGGHVETLAGWTRQAAERAGERDLALRAVRALWVARPGLADYRAAQSLAGDDWPDLRAWLLAELGKNVARLPWAHAQGAIAVYLDEGLLDEAMSTADKVPHDSALAARVADAVLDRAPEWVLRTARRYAEGIMNAGSSGLYEDAARWVERARDAWLVRGREAEWRAYIDGLLATHGRKYKLVPLLKALRE